MADHHQANAMLPPAAAPPTSDAAARALQEPQHNEQGVAPRVNVQASSNAAADVSAPIQHNDPQHALQTQQLLGQPALGGVPEAGGDSGAPVATATPPEATPSLPPPVADEQAAADSTVATVAEARAPVELAADRTLDNVLHAVPPTNAPV